MRFAIGFLTLVLVASASIYSQSMFRKINDFDGDGKADFAVTREEGGLKMWYIWQTTAGFRRTHWGVTTTDANVPGDYDGDRKTDVAIMRRDGTNECRFHILRSLDGAYEIRSVSVFFESACGAIQQDYDGDGKTDPANKESGVTGFVSYRLSATNSPGTFESPPLNPGIRVGDIDGDGAAEFASVNNSTRQITFRHIPTGNTFTRTFGVSGDIFAPADFDGDGIGDLTIFRPSTGDWWWIRSIDSVVNVLHWGVNGDLPVPADYDNDGKTDQAVYRPGNPNGIYYINGSVAGFQAFAWGVPGDTLVRY